MKESYRKGVANHPDPRAIWAHIDSPKIDCAGVEDGAELSRNETLRRLRGKRILHDFNSYSSAMRQVVSL
jgi:hypothetical protein